MTSSGRRGFSLIEILIVVVVLGILAAIIVPQFSGSSESARYSATIENLLQLRAAIDVYKNQHIGQLPGVPGADPDVVFAAQLAKPTNTAGDRSSNPDEGYGDPNFPLGPYVPNVLPPNPFNGSRRVRTVATFPGSAPGGSGNSSAGWIYEITSGRIRINKTGNTPNGQLYWNL
jgi:general secretion pathway protein G